MVDDEPDIVKLVVEVIRDMGHISEVAKDGQQAMQKLKADQYDLIITDIRMPHGFTGEKLHNFIKFREPALAQRMIFITGDVLNPETLEFLENTGNLFLEKPFPLENLEDCIHKALRCI